MNLYRYLDFVKKYFEKNTFLLQSDGDSGAARSFRELVRMGTDCYGEYGQARYRLIHKILGT